MTEFKHYKSSAKFLASAMLGRMIGQKVARDAGVEKREEERRDQERREMQGYTCERGRERDKELFLI